MPNLRDIILDLVRQIPAGHVANYGQVADFVPGVRARQVGHILSGGTATLAGVPWHRVINAGGTISPHPGAAEQRRLLEAEGIVFNHQGRIAWADYRWAGPGPVWLAEHGFEPGF